jgi:hypothetical protein
VKQPVIVATCGTNEGTLRCAKMLLAPQQLLALLLLLLLALPLLRRL